MVGLVQPDDRQSETVEMNLFRRMGEISWDAFWRGFWMGSLFAWLVIGLPTFIIYMLSR